MTADSSGRSTGGEGGASTNIQEDSQSSNYFATNYRYSEDILTYVPVHVDVKVEVGKQGIKASSGSFVEGRMLGYPG